MSDVSQERAINWIQVWAEVGSQIRFHRSAGRRHLLTEDTVRLFTIFALEGVGVSPDRIVIEVLDPALRGGKLDLVTTGASSRSVVELKYPRASKTGISPDTMTLGEVLRDFLRVALVEAEDRWVVTVLQPEARRYLARREALRWVEEPGKQLVLDRGLLEALPKTAREAIGQVPWLLPVRATCAVALSIDVDLALFAFRVDAPIAGTQPVQISQTVPSVQRPQMSPPVANLGARPDGARAAIITAIRSLTIRSGHDEVTMDEVVRELQRGGSPYAESTIRTMMASHMCAQAHGPGVSDYQDLDRVARGTYRLRDR